MPGPRWREALCCGVSDMYPLNVVLVGCGNELLAQVRAELGALGAKIETEFLGFESAITAIREMRTEAGHGGGMGQLDPNGKHLYVAFLETARDLPNLKRLASLVVGQPLIALLGFGQDLTDPIQAQRHGASQVVMVPIHSDDFRQALESIATLHGLVPTTNKVISVAGVTGGCGTTTIAINLAYELAHLHPFRVILAELSLQMGKLAISLNVEPRYTTHDLLREIHRLDLYVVQQALTPVADRMSILAGPYEAVSTLSVTSHDVLILLDSLRQLAEVVVVDVPSTFDSMYFDTLNASDHVVLVGQQKVPTIRALQMVSASLQDKTPFLVLNRYDASVPGFGVNKIKDMLHVPEMFTICSDYAAVSGAMNVGRPLRVQAPKSKVVQDISTLAGALVPHEDCQPAPKANGTGHGFRGLMKKLGIG